MSAEAVDLATLSASDTKAGRLQRACLDLLREHERKGDIPTNGHFLFYELEQRGVIPKNYDGVNPKTGQKWARTPLQDVSVATHASARGGPIPWHWIEDETRSLDNWRYADNVADYLQRHGRPSARSICGKAKSRRSSFARAAHHHGRAARPRVPVPRADHRHQRAVRRLHRHRYRAAAEGRTGASSMSAILNCEDRPIRSRQNTKRYIEEHTGRDIWRRRWTKIALTEKQVKANTRLQRLVDHQTRQALQASQRVRGHRVRGAWSGRTGTPHPQAPRPPAARATRRCARTRKTAARIHAACAATWSAAMTARIIPFPQRAPFAVRIEREGPAWLVTCRDHGWLHGDRDAAIADANTIARGFGVVVNHSSTIQREFARANAAAPEGAYATTISAPNLAQEESRHDDDRQKTTSMQCTDRSISELPI